MFARWFFFFNGHQPRWFHTFLLIRLMFSLMPTKHRMSQCRSFSHSPDGLVTQFDFQPSQFCIWLGKNGLIFFFYGPCKSGSRCHPTFGTALILPQNLETGSVSPFHTEQLWQAAWRGLEAWFLPLSRLCYGLWFWSIARLTNGMASPEKSGKCRLLLVKGFPTTEVNAHTGLLLIPH